MKDLKIKFLRIRLNNEKERLLKKDNMLSFLAVESINYIIYLLDEGVTRRKVLLGKALSVLDEDLSICNLDDDTGYQIRSLLLDILGEESE